MSNEYSDRDMYITFIIRMIYELGEDSMESDTLKRISNYIQRIWLRKMTE